MYNNNVKREFIFIESELSGSDVTSTLFHTDSTGNVKICENHYENVISQTTKLLENVLQKIPELQVLMK